MLADTVEPLAYEAAFWMQTIENPNSPIDAVAAAAEVAAGNFRGIAVIAMLTEASVDGFGHNLMRAALTRLKYLQRAGESDPSNHAYVSGRYEALLDALASNSISLARELIRYAPKQWRERHEYLDDYCFAQVLHGLVMGDLSEQELVDLGSKFDNYVLVADSRMAVLRAIHARNSEDFDEAFSELLDERDARIKDDIERGQMETPVIVAERSLNIGGIALLNLAERYGIAVQREFRQCPSIARQVSVEPFVGM